MIDIFTLQRACSKKLPARGTAFPDIRTLMSPQGRTSGGGASRGVTLVELLVSLTVFSVVMLISTGTLLIMIDINAKAQALYSSSTNLSYALDNITRELRMGYGYYCSTINGGLPTNTNDCPSGADGIAFTRGVDGTRLGYRLFDDGGRGVLQQSDGNGWIDITSSDVNITTFELVVNGTDTTNDSAQPYVELHIEGSVANGLDTTTDFKVQSRIVQHKLDR